MYGKELRSQQAKAGKEKYGTMKNNKYEVYVDGQQIEGVLIRASSEQEAMTKFKRTGDYEYIKDQMKGARIEFEEVG